MSLPMQNKSEHKNRLASQSIVPLLGIQFERVNFQIKPTHFQNPKLVMLHIFTYFCFEVKPLTNQRLASSIQLNWFEFLYIIFCFLFDLKVMTTKNQLPKYKLGTFYMFTFNKIFTLPPLLKTIASSCKLLHLPRMRVNMQILIKFNAISSVIEVYVKLCALTRGEGN